MVCLLLRRRLTGYFLDAPFLSSFQSLAPEVYETKPVYFIVKDQVEKRIRQAVERTLQQIQGEPVLVFRTGTVHHSVPCRDVLFPERILRRTRIKTIQTEKWVRESGRKAIGEIFHIDTGWKSQRLFLRCKTEGEPVE